MTAIVDYNRIQALGKSEEVINLEPFARRIIDFGWAVKEINGHNFTEIENSLSQSLATGKPSCIIARTVKGKGLRNMENMVSCHYQCVPDGELEEAYRELGVEYADCV
ncbi:MAG: hypothetical protein AB1798_22305 [Spirochaetota bacterium]